VSASLWRITRATGDSPPALLSSQIETARSADIQNAIDFERLDQVRVQIFKFKAGQGLMTGLQLHYHFELSNPLILLNVVLRKGIRNRLSNGLQQTYADHTRLLLHGIDMLEAGAID
jgi:hypothetical protein